MKRLLLVVWALCAHTVAHAQSAPTVEVDDSGAMSVEAMVQSVFEHVNLAAVPTGVLLEHGYSSIDPAPYEGTPNPSRPALLPMHWRQLYAGMYRGVLAPTSPLPVLSEVDSLVSNYGYRNTSFVIPIAVLRYAYNTVDTMSLRDNLFTVQGIQLHDVPGRSRSPYLNRTLFAASQPFEMIVSGTHSFVPDPNLYFSNDNLSPQWYRLTYQRNGQTIQVDSDRPWGTHTTLNAYPTGFSDGGLDFEIITTVGYANGQTLESRCAVKVIVDNDNADITAQYAPPEMSNGPSPLPGTTRADG